jgi:hypothetical protein
MSKLKIYASFEEQKQQELEDTRLLSPMERIKQVVDLIRKIYDFKTQNKRKKQRKITFVKVQ